MIKPALILLAVSALLASAPALAQNASAPLLGGPIATQLEKAEVTGTGIGLSMGGSGNYTVKEVKLLPPLTQDELDQIARSLPQPVTQAAFVRAVDAYYVAAELDGEYFDADGNPLHPLPPGMVVDIRSTTKLPDGRVNGPHSTVTDGRFTASRDETHTPNVFYGFHFEVGLEDGQMTISRLHTYNEGAVLIRDLVMDSGATVTIPMPDGGATTITATYRKASAAELAMTGIPYAGYALDQGTTMVVPSGSVVVSRPTQAQSSEAVVAAQAMSAQTAALLLQEAMAGLRADPPAQLPR